MKEEDEEVVNFKSEIKHIFIAASNNFADEVTKINDIKTSLKQAKDFFETIVK